METTKQEILNILAGVINALNKVQIAPGKENWLNQGGAIAMLEDVYQRIGEQLEDRPDKDGTEG